MTEQRYYGDQAYNSENIPQQPFRRSTRIGALSMQLPWGNPQKFIPPTFWHHMRPKHLREIEERETGEPGRTARLTAKFGTAFDHRRIRYAPASAWSNFWLYMEGFGRWFFFIIFGTLIISTPFVMFALRESSLTEIFSAIFEISIWTLIPCLAAWLIGYLGLTYIPEECLEKPSRKGPVWEMNRQTGMVTIFARKKGQFRKYGIEGNFIAPFYEFDAAIHTIPDRQGMPWNMLNLLHRYTPVGIDFSVVMGKQRLVEPCMAMWDFWQRYMDISQPLPEIPLLEQYRHLDPTTARYDQSKARPPRFWRDMDEKTFDEKLREMGDTSAITMNRPDLMWKYRPVG